MRRAQQKPSDGSPHWSCRKLSEELGVSKSTMQRILAHANRHLWALPLLALVLHLNAAIALTIDRFIRFPKGLVGRLLNSRPFVFIGLC